MMQRRASILVCCLFGLILVGRAKEDCVKSCEEGGWPKERLDDYCYHWSTTSKTWDKAEAYCERSNGHLAAVTSSKIHNFLMKKVNADYEKTWYWIGGTDKSQERKWKWIDGSEWKFTNWSTSPEKQPNNIRGHDCLQIYHKINAKNGWNDEDCDIVKMFICSWKICQGDHFFVDTNLYIETPVQIILRSDSNGLGAGWQVLF